MDLKAVFGNIKRCRSCRGMTIDEMSSKTGIAANVLRACESGRCVLGLSQIKLICDVLRVDVPTIMLPGVQGCAFDEAGAVLRDYVANSRVK